MTRLLVMTEILFMIVLCTFQFSDAKLRKLQAKIDVALMDIMDFKKDLDEIWSHLNSTDSVLGELAAKQECKCQKNDGSVDTSVSSRKIERIEKKHIEYILRGVQDEKLKTDSIINNFMKKMDVTSEKFIKQFETETKRQQSDFDNFNKTILELINSNERVLMENMNIIKDKIDQLETKYEILKGEVNYQSVDMDNLNNTVGNIIKRFEKDTGQQEDDFDEFGETDFEGDDLVEIEKLKEDATDCYSLKKTYPNLMSGMYEVELKDIGPVEVYCDMKTDGGGWTVFQNRFNGSVDFYRTFDEYDQGFGDLNGEFWLGLRYIQAMTKSVRSVLRLDLEAASGRTAYETFDDFHLSDGPFYKLNIDPGVGTAGDNEGLSYSMGMPFSTKDKDHSSNECPSKDRGGWWYENCAFANLNGEYITPGTKSSFSYGEGGMTYRDFDGLKSLRKSKMMFRKLDTV